MLHINDSVPDQILEAALELFAEKGVVETYMRDIAKKVGVRETTIYYHFEGKNGILDELLERYNHMQVIWVAETLASMYMTKKAGKINGDMVAKMYRDDLQRSISLLAVAYEKIMDVEQYRNPSVIKAHYHNRYVLPVDALEVIIRTTQHLGLIREDSPARMIAEQLSYIENAVFKRYILERKLSEEDLETCRQEIIEHMLNLYDLYAIADEVAVGNDACIRYAYYIVEKWPEFMKWIAFRFEAFGIMDDFIESLKDHPDLYELAKKKQKELQEMGPSTFAETDFEDSLYIENWKEIFT